MTAPEPPKVKTVWGKVVLYLREHKNVALHVVCGDITEVELEGDRLILKTAEQFLYDMITSSENMQEIKNAIAWQGLSLNVAVIKLKKDEELVEEDLAKLSRLGINFRRV